MQITLTQAELTDAVRSYVAQLGISRPFAKINFVASRNDGIVTEIDLSAPEEPKQLKAVEEKSPERVAEAPEPEPETASEPDETVDEEDEECPLPEGKSLFG